MADSWIKIIWRKFYYFYNNQILKNAVKLKIDSMEETIEKIEKNRLSIARYGNGELDIINKKSIKFQAYDPELGEKLKNILSSNGEKTLICIPGALVDTDYLTEKAKFFWDENLKTGRYFWVKYLNRKQVYGDSLLTRPYMDFKDKTKSEKIFAKLKKIWNQRDILIIEGKESKLGVGNDLFDNSNSIKRILCPSENSYTKYKEIKEYAEKILENQKDTLVLIALGPTATVLAYELSEEGYQVLDIGHIDIEYEWYKKNATEKIKVIGKYTNEVDGGDSVEKIDDAIYQKQIIKNIEIE